MGKKKVEHQDLVQMIRLNRHNNSVKVLLAQLSNKKFLTQTLKQLKIVLGIEQVTTANLKTALQELNYC